VVDDCSEDDTIAIVDSFCTADVRLVRSQDRSGASGARNAGITYACGELVAFLDADDEWRPSKLERQVALICSDDRFIFVTCRCDIVSSVGVNLGDLYDGRRLRNTRDVW
jgi:glycosyltransferase involved in cell wall biosynthesis